MKRTLAVFAFGAALAFAGGIASTPAAAASPDNAAGAAKGLETNHAVSDTDMSSHRRRWRHRYYVRHVRPWPVYRYGYYRPRPYFYRPYSYAYYPRPYSYAYYPRRYYRPYYRPGPSFSIGFGFGPSFYW